MHASDTKHTVYGLFKLQWTKILFIFRGHSTRELHQLSVTTSKETCFTLRARTGTAGNATAYPGKKPKKLRRGFGKNASEWSRRVEISSRKKSLAEGVACMAIFWPTPGLIGRTFELWVLNTWALISASAAPDCELLLKHGFQNAYLLKKFFNPNRVKLISWLCSEKEQWTVTHTKKMDVYIILFMTKKF